MTNSVTIRNAELFFKNFSGRVDNYNRDGRRYFNVYIDDPAVAQQMNEEGWRIRVRQPRDPSEPVRNYIKVFVSYRYGTPKIIRRLNGVDYFLNEDTVGILDSDVITEALVQFHPASKDKAPDGLYSAYLDQMVAFVEEDEFQKAYKDILGENGEA